MKTIHNLIILDASGSMSSKVPEVIGGINLLIDDLKTDESTLEGVTNKTTIVDFSSHNDFKVIYQDTATSDLAHIDNTQYSARGMTALYDAIGKAFMLIPNGSKDVLVTIFTDGLENDSKEFKETSIKALIDSKKELGWTVTYMGTTAESMLEASSMGIHEEDFLPYADSDIGTRKAFYSLSLAKKKYTVSKMEGKEVNDIFDKKKTT